MHLQRDSAAGVRFLACLREGRDLKPAARAAGIGKGTGYRWLRETFVVLRDQGRSVEQGRLVQGHRVSPFYELLGRYSQSLTRWPALIGDRHGYHDHEL